MSLGGGKFGLLGWMNWEASMAEKSAAVRVNLSGGVGNDRHV